MLISALFSTASYFQHQPFHKCFCWSLIGFSCICSQPKILNYDIHIKPYFYFKIELYTASFFLYFTLSEGGIVSSCWWMFVVKCLSCLTDMKGGGAFFSRSLKVLARELRFLVLCLFLYIVKLSWTEHKKDFIIDFKQTSTDKE